jgi:hypothetical protein
VTGSRSLKKAAKARGSCLNQYVLGLLESDHDLHARRARMRKGRKEFRAFVAALPYMGDSTPLIREDRDTDHGRERSHRL